ncbi:MAG TPA: right-handed parallel beta-helix repeat-containing protein, partial [Gemmatimonadales bacterium]|nr:right-handed parallel beta-helix repeat-containing protein [Gemmatimonadales bacterium]
YNEAISFALGGSAVTGFITLQGDPGAILDGTGKSGAGITINNRNYIRIAGMTVRNFKSGNTPMGISVQGTSSYIELRDNLIHNIESPNGNAHGIAFYGTGATPMTNIVVEGNEIRNCRLGQSEALVLNGNVDGFTVAGNTVHDNDNIGIDFIGFEGTGPLGQDQARNGVCVDNVVYNISSATNPTYGGDRSADGIYVDGGRDIVIERNKVDNCDIGIEVASEHLGKTTSNITVRNNFISRGYQGNILMGGYDAARGNAHNVVVVNNTTYQGTNGEIELQYNCDGITIKNNILYAGTGQSYISNGGGNNTNVVVDNNVYFGASSTSPGSYPDARARFVNPLLVTPLTDLHLQAVSPAIDAGINLGNDAQGQPLSGAWDVDGGPRIRGSAIDIGAHEFASGGLDTNRPAPVADLRTR